MNGFIVGSGMGATEEDFWRRVDVSAGESGCWIWSMKLRKDGYGTYYFSHGNYTLAHRVAFSFTNDGIPAGLQIDHLCRNRSCVNPLHLEAVTQEENIRRGLAGLHNAIKTHCPHGHEYTKENVTMSKHGCRSCKVCHRDSGRRRTVARRSA